jgi:hypothetical protein
LIINKLKVIAKLIALCYLFILMTKPNKPKKTMQTSQPKGFEAILASDGKFSIMSYEAIAQELGDEYVESYRKTRINESKQRSDRERVMTATSGEFESEINKVAFRITKNLKHFHECGRLWEKGGEDGEKIPASISHSISKRSKKLVSIQDWSETGKVKPLSDNDLDEIFLAARVALMKALASQKASGASPSLKDAWKEAAREARRELYLVTKEQTFASRTRAESYSSKAREFAWEHYSDLADLQGFSVQETLIEYFSEDADIHELAARAKRALVTRYQAKACYEPSKMLRSSTLQAIQLLNEFKQLVENQAFVLPKRKSTEKKTALQQSLERLAFKVREGQSLQSAWDKGLDFAKMQSRKARKAKKQKAQVIQIEPHAIVLTGFAKRLINKARQPLVIKSLAALPKVK